MYLCKKFKPLDPHTLSKEDYNEILDSHLFLKDNKAKYLKKGW